MKSGQLSCLLDPTTLSGLLALATKNLVDATKTNQKQYRDHLLKTEGDLDELTIKEESIDGASAQVRPALGEAIASDTEMAKEEE